MSAVDVHASVGDMPHKLPPSGLRAELLDALISVTSCLLVGLPVLLLVERTPAAWLEHFDVLGPALRPWLMGAAMLVLLVPTFLIVDTVLRSALRGKRR
ncbi:hypothetical protein [Phenylobacterium sp.]|uniref:hypothetical protein n=1 Tax=Phenylobacterium sp. TaxID=1871053 RepID=UPI0025F3C5A0|nr:hypothetical protein [Phenylobacterium sp.]